MVRNHFTFLQRAVNRNREKMNWHETSAETIWKTLKAYEFGEVD